LVNVLYFTDAHCDPEDVDIWRFEALGQLIVDYRPDVIVQGGDFCTFDSLSHWSLDKRKEMELRRFSKDVDNMNKCWKQVCQPLYEVQERARQASKRMYRPQLIWFEGNHEDWVRQYCERHPVLDGTIDLDRVVRLNHSLFSDVDYVKFGNLTDDGVRFVEDVAFTHAPRNRGGIINSRYITSRALSESFATSVVFGHTHRFCIDSIARITAPNETRITQAINGGCFFTRVPQYACNNTNDWWSGVLLFQIDGDTVDIQTISLENLKRRYYNERST
jgi:predicted phosphodiesterase